MSRCGLALLLCVLTRGASFGADTMPRPAAVELVSADRVLLIGHRGYSKRAPENTLPAFRAAVEAGADLVELDYYHSADGVPVVVHDAELDRTTNARQVFAAEKVKVHSCSLAELRRLDVGSWFGPRFSGTRMPTLSEAIDAIQAGSLTLIERKGGDARTCVELLKQKQVSRHVVVQSFDWDYVAECHRLDPQLVLAALGDKELTGDKLDSISRTGARVVGWDERQIGHKEIDAIHRRGLKVWVYTVNEIPRARELVGWGIDGIITDAPGELLAVVRREE